MNAASVFGEVGCVDLQIGKAARVGREECGCCIIVSVPMVNSTLTHHSVPLVVLRSMRRNELSGI